MSWFDNIQWFLLLVIVMKVLILAAVAALVISVIARHPCPDYCVYLVGDGRDLSLTPECNCNVYTHTRFHDAIDESPIFHPAASFPRIPEYLYPHPFYIFYPLTHGMPHYLSDIDSLTPESSRPPSSLRRHNSEIEISIDSAHGIINGEEDDVQSSYQRPNAPLYLDINVESEDERSASRATITAEEREAIEQSLSECANLHALLYAKKGEDSKLRNFFASDNLSAVELENTIDDKCSQISKVVEKTLNEIKESRPKKTGDTFSTNGEGEQEIEMPRSTNVHKINKQALCASVTDGNLQAHFRGVASTSAASTTTAKIQSSSDIYPKIEDVTTITTERIWEQREHTTPTSIGNEYPFNIETVSWQPTTEGVQELIESTKFADIATTPTNIEEQGILNSQGKDQKLPQTNNEEERSEDRPHYNEGEVPLTKIITHEFSNNTVQSYVNGTEDIPNGDFSDELEPIDVYNEFGNSSEYFTSSQASRNVEDTTSNANIDMQSEGDISGNLYFLFNSHQIPARFVQDNNGSLSVGIDGPSICNRLTAESEPHSALITTLCNCYKSGSCIQKKTNN